MRGESASALVGPASLIISVAAALLLLVFSESKPVEGANEFYGAARLPIAPHAAAHPSI